MILYDSLLKQLNKFNCGRKISILTKPLKINSSFSIIQLEHTTNNSKNLLFTYNDKTYLVIFNLCEFEFHHNIGGVKILWLRHMNSIEKLKCNMIIYNLCYSLYRSNFNIQSL